MTTATTPFASVDAIDSVPLKMTVQLLAGAIPAENAVVTANSASTKDVDVIVKEIAETSTNPEVQKVNAKIDELTEHRAKLLLAEAKQIKANAGSPDVAAESQATALVVGLLKALATFPDSDRVNGLLPNRVKTTSRTTGAASATGPKSDQSKMREWLRANGHTVGDRGQLKAELIEAYHAGQK